MKKYCFLIIFCLLSLASLAEGYVHNLSLTVRDGLPTNSVRHIAQDRFGFIWFGTDRGLCRFDGMHILAYTIPGESPYLYITSLCAFKDGLFIGTEAGLWFHNAKNNVFTKIDQKAQDGTVIKSTITSLNVSPDSILWVGTSSQGVFSYSHNLHHYSVGKNLVNKVYADDDNRVWALTAESNAPLLLLNRSSNAFRPITSPVLSDRPLNNSRIVPVDIIRTKDGTYWLATWTQGILTFNFPKYASPSSQITLTQKIGGIEHIHTIYELDNDNILVGADKGLFAYSPSTGNLTSFTGTAAGGAAPFIYDILADGESGIWTTSFFNGIDYFTQPHTCFASITQPQYNGLSGNVINRFCEDNNGMIWVSSDDGGLNLYSPVTRSFIDFTGKEALSHYNIHALSLDGDKLWIGTYSNGLKILDTRSGAIQQLAPDANYPSLNSIYSILVDSRGYHWIGTMDNVILISDINSRPLLSKKLGALIIDIKEDHHGTIWFATQGTGIWAYNMRSKQWKQYHVGNKVSKDQITSIAVDDAGNVFASAEDGLYRYNSSNNAFEALPGLSAGNQIMSIVEEQGKLWYSTLSDIICRTPDGKEMQYGTANGISSGQFIPNAVIRTSTGQILFGSTQGFTIFHPRDIKPAAHLPQVYITGLTVFDHPISADDPRLTDEQGNHTDIPFANVLHLNYDENMITISFASLSFASPKACIYKYMLEGVNKDWNVVTGEGNVSYANLAPGTYTFHVKATNNDGSWNDDETTLTIVITPPLLWNPIAWTIYALLIFAIACFAFLRWKHHREEEYQQHLHELDVKKQAEMRDIRLEFYTTIAHEIRTPVSLIIAPLETIIDNLKKSTTPSVEGLGEALSVVLRNANRLLELVNQLLDFNKVQQIHQVHFELGNIVSVLLNVTERFEATLKQQNIEFNVSVPSENVDAYIDSEMLTKVISNLLSNARKYTRTKIDVRLTHSESIFCIIVADDGMGVSEEDKKRIFAPFYQAKNNKPGTGIGLSIVQNIVKMFHGNVDVESSEGKGTKFIVTIPKDQASMAIGEEEATSQTTQTTQSTQTPQSQSLFCDTSQNPQPPSNHTTIYPPSGGSEGLPTLLVVEDDYDLLHFIVNSFKEYYTVITAQNGKQALQQLRHYDVSVIISDWMMPEMEGDELCRCVRSDAATSHIPFIMLTAKTDDDSKTAGTDCGADVYIEKPFSVKYLHACIRNIVKMRKELFLKFSKGISQSIEDVAPTPIDNEFLKSITAIIEANISNSDLNVNFLANELCVSRSSLFSKIKSITDATPNEMIQVMRLRKAAELLLDSKHRATEVCYMVGFSNPSYFTKCFQKQFGCTPSKYAQQNNAT